MRSVVAVACTLSASALLGACDNVQWGGAELAVNEPEFEAAETAEPEVGDTATEVAGPVLPFGPVLFHVERLDRSGRATIEAVAEVSGGELRSLEPRRADQAAEYAADFAARYYRPDRSYTLSIGRARVGSFIVTAPIEATSPVCPRLRASGQLELRPEADTMTEFLAWPPGVRSGRDPLMLPTYRSDMRQLAPVLAERGIRGLGIQARWRIRVPADIRAVRVGRRALGFAATFLVADSLAEGPPADSAGMVFVVADYAPARGYSNLYVDAMQYGPGQKRALRWLDAIDLVSDSTPEWVVRAYGDAAAWYEVVGRRDGTLAVLWSSRRPVCEAQEPG